MRITENDNWYEIWEMDREAMLNTMIRNMTADLEAGYNYSGESIKRQKAQIEEYKAETDAQRREFLKMFPDMVNRWCYYDLKKRGAIA